MKFTKKILSSSLIAFSLISGAPNATADTSVSGSALSAYAAASRAIVTSLAGALQFFYDLQTAVLAIDPNGTMNLLSTGVINVTVFGTTYGILFTGPAPQCASVGVPTSPHFTIVDGQLELIDHLGGCTLVQIVSVS